MKRSRGGIQHRGLRDMHATSILLSLSSPSVICLTTVTGVTVSQGCDQLLRKLQKKKKMLYGNIRLWLSITVTTMNESSAVAIYSWPWHRSVVKNPPANAGDAGLTPGWGKFPGGGHGNPLQCSYLGNPMP